MSVSRCCGGGGGRAKRPLQGRDWKGKPWAGGCVCAESTGACGRGAGRRSRTQARSAERQEPLNPASWRLRRALSLFQALLFLFLPLAPGEEKGCFARPGLAQRKPHVVCLSSGGDGASWLASLGRKAFLLPPPPTRGASGSAPSFCLAPPRSEEDNLSL